MNYIQRVSEAQLRDKLQGRDVVLLLGARQVGKTTLVNRVLSEEDAVRTFNLDVLSDFAVLQSVTPLDPEEALRRLGSPRYLVIDEAQRFPEIGRIMKGWYDKNLPVKIILLGSSSLNLVDSTAEPLTGRNQKLELPPLLFEEILRNQSWFDVARASRGVAAAFHDQIQALLLQHLIYGSYPASLHKQNKEEYLRNLASDYVMRDVLQIASIREPEVVRKLLLALAYQTGQLVSANELANSLGVARKTIERYLDILESSYIIFRLPPYSTNKRKELFKTHKIYFWDTGIRNALLNDFSAASERNDLGQMFENYVIAEFAKQNLLRGHVFQLHYWRSRNQSEVDLVVAGGGSMRAYEIKWKNERKSGHVFTNEYGVAVQRITAATFPNVILDFETQDHTSI